VSLNPSFAHMCSNTVLAQPAGNCVSPKRTSLVTDNKVSRLVLGTINSSYPTILTIWQPYIEKVTAARYKKRQRHNPDKLRFFSPHNITFPIWANLHMPAIYMPSNIEYLLRRGHMLNFLIDVKKCLTSCLPALIINEARILEPAIWRITKIFTD
jgi:hypothetical protein